MSPGRCANDETPPSIWMGLAGCCGAALVGGIAERVDVSDVESGALHGDELVVDLGAVDGMEGVNLAPVGGVDLVVVSAPSRGR